MSYLKTYNTRAIYFTEYLKKKMDFILEYPCTLIEAPMGYGKTTAVRAYIRNTDTFVLWQKIYDSSITGFWSDFCRLFIELSAECSASLTLLGFPNDSVSMQESLRLIEEIILPNETILVLDDYHLLSQNDVGNFIHFLVVNEIDHLHIVLIARFVELPNIEALSLKGYLYHITKKTFELMPIDIIKYYKLCGITLNDSQSSKLYSITEGWISALYLMMLNFIEEGNLGGTSSIYKLVEKTLYLPLSYEIKEFLLTICIFESFSLKQATAMWQNDNTDVLLFEITSKNTLIKYDEVSRTYQMHNIFTKFLKDIFESKPENYRRQIYEKAANWYLLSGNYFTSMQYFYLIKDFDNLMAVVAVDKGHCIYNERKESFIQFFEECPSQIIQQHPIALLIYAINLFMLNEFERFGKVCQSFTKNIQIDNNLGAENLNMILGEFELLLSFTEYNNISKMLEHIQKAAKLLTQPATFIDTKEGWTFGSPSVLYMFYRESGALETEVQIIKEALPFYSQITQGHGNGGEFVMEAEWYFNRGDLENAEIIAHTALYEATRCEQHDILMCAIFLQARIALFKGDYAHIVYLFEKLHEEMTQRKQSNFLHTLDLCVAFIQAGIGNTKIPLWIKEGHFESSRLFFPAKAFMNIVYGKVLLVNKAYTKLLGIAEQLLNIASVFPNLLSFIYIKIYVSSANEQIGRRENALIALKSALEVALPDKLYMPFVENCDTIKILLETLSQQGLYQEDIKKILVLYKPYQKAVEHIKLKHFSESAPPLAERELEIARLAAEGFSNREIGERLYITQNTVKTILKRVFEKLSISSRALLKQYFEEQTEK